MHHFHYVGGELYCEEVPLSELAERYGTPAYVYSHATLTRHFRAFDEPFAGHPHLTCYSVKACSNLALLRLFAGMGAGFDIVSGGELYRVLQAGGDPGKVVYSGVGKTEAELRYALESEILMFNVESEAELKALDRVCAAVGRRAQVALRVNPEIDPRTHSYIATSLRETKFGIAREEVFRLYEEAQRLEYLDPVGIDCHLGSQLTTLAPFMEGLLRLMELVGRLKSEGMVLRFLDLGGGLGITYRDEEPPLPQEYAEEILSLARNLDLTLILEPGRVIVGNAAVLLTRVLYTKRTGEKNFVIVDAAMNDCIRPSLYGAYHEIKPVREPQENTFLKPVDVVGPICESGDFLAKNRPLPPLAAGGLAAIMSAGAYCASMASNYNSRPRAPEILVAGNQTYLIRARETKEDLIRGEQIPDFLRA